MQIKLSEIPHIVIQGEGKYTGRRMLLFRLKGCNLKCRACDSKYTWNNPKYILYNEEMIKAEIEKHNTKDILITGGEPLLQKQALLELITRYKQYKFHIETNGSIELSEFEKYENTFFSISPKITSSLSPSEPYTLKALKDLPRLKEFIIKVVIKAENLKSDLNSIEELIEKYNISKNLVYLMPFGYTKKTILKESKIILKKAIENGFNFSPRLHIMIFGNKRYV